MGAAFARALRAPRQQVKRALIVGDGKVGLPCAVLRLDLQFSVTALGRDGQRALSDLDGLTVLTGNVPQARTDIREDSSQACAIAEPGGQDLGFAHDRQDIVITPERNERDTKVESRVDGLRECLWRLGQLLQCFKRLTKKLDRGSIRRSSDHSFCGQPKVFGPLVPRLGTYRVTGETLGVLARLIRLSALQRLQGVLMQLSPALVQEARVRDFVGQRMFEGVFELREEACLIQEFGSLEMGETSSEVTFAVRDDGLK